MIHDAPDGDQHQLATAGRRRRPRWPTPGRASGAHVGFALDGDADRCVAVDGEGNLVDGDQVLGILALDRLARGVLDEGSLVVSVLSNGGLQAVVEAAGGRIVRTPVGDKHILAAMLVSGAGLGGEKSGHVIIREHTTSGDGIVTAIELLRVMTAARPGIATSRPRCRFCRSSSARSASGTATSGRRTSCSGRPSPTPSERLAPHGRVLVRPSGPNPCCGSWSRAGRDV